MLYILESLYSRQLPSAWTAGSDLQFHVVNPRTRRAIVSTPHADRARRTREHPISVAANDDFSSCRSQHVRPDFILMSHTHIHPLPAYPSSVPHHDSQTLRMPPVARAREANAVGLIQILPHRTVRQQLPSQDELWQISTTRWWKRVLTTDAVKVAIEYARQYRICTQQDECICERDEPRRHGYDGVVAFVTGLGVVVQHEWLLRLSQQSFSTFVEMIEDTYHCLSWIMF
jgi:hypothetical protein